MSTVAFNRFPAIRAELLRGGGQIVRKGAFDVQGRAQDFAPVDTGNLKSSIFAAELDALRWIVATVVEYGPHQEYGTVNQSGTPFMRPAAERVRPAYIEAWRQFLGGLR